MTRLTFLIGNGFDLNVGLNTKYRDFYDYYISNHPDDMLAKAIEENYVYWSDLELGLGRCTKNIKEEDEEAFWHSEENLEEELRTYLKSEMERVNIKNDERKRETAIEMQRSLTEFQRELPEVQRKHIKIIFDRIMEGIEYSFITFNYTKVLDQCISATREVIRVDFGKHNVGGRTFDDIIGDVLHIHGATDTDMVLGVNDEEQIANKEFIKNPSYRQILIKEETNRRLDNGKIEEARKMIDESVILCTFGISIGSTDRMWWQYICEWLRKDGERRLIIFIKVEKEEGKKGIGKYTLFTRQDEMLDRLKTNAGMSDEAWNGIKGQVYVKCNAEIFNFKIVDKKL